MSTRLKRGIVVWILGSLTFLTAVNAFNAVRLWETKNLEYPVRVSLPIPGLENIGAPISVLLYLWISVITTIAFIGLTATVAYRELPPNTSLLLKIDGLEEEVKDSAKIVRSTNESFLIEAADSRKEREKFFKDVNASMEKVRKETSETLESHGKTIRKFSADLEDVRREMREALVKHGEELGQVRQLSWESAATVKRQSKDVAEITDRLRKIEEGLMPQPLLTSRDELEKIKGIGPQLGKELRAIGITNVGELAVGDARTIAEKTRASREMAEHLQATAQLLMIPGVSETGVELLEEVGITAVKDLAGQDPIQLSRKIREISKTYIEQGKISETEKPTLEEISFWIRQAKT